MTLRRYLTELHRSIIADIEKKTMDGEEDNKIAMLIGKLSLLADIMMYMDQEYPSLSATREPQQGI